MPLHASLPNTHSQPSLLLCCRPQLYFNSLSSEEGQGAADSGDFYTSERCRQVGGGACLSSSEWGLF
jgi:hypothetical protein